MGDGITNYNFSYSIKLGDRNSITICGSYSSEKGWTIKLPKSQMLFKSPRDLKVLVDEEFPKESDLFNTNQEFFQTWYSLPESKRKDFLKNFLAVV